MPATTVIVQHRDGSPASGQKVTLLFDHSGVSESVRTNSRGEATVSHSATGSCRIVVGGKTRVSKFRAPGRTAITLS